MKFDKERASAQAVVERAMFKEVKRMPEELREILNHELYMAREAETKTFVSPPLSLIYAARAIDTFKEIAFRDKYQEEQREYSRKF